MKKLLVIMLTAASLDAAASEITQQAFSQLFKNYHACFILYDLNEHKIVSEYNPNNRCKERIAPDSSFKIALSLIAFDQGLINQATVFKWDGKKREITEANQDLNPKTWLQYSAAWVSQELAPKLGYARIKKYLAAFHYGNEDFRGDPGMHNGLQYAWLGSSLKISALEQLDFLKAMLNEELQVSKEAIVNTKNNLYQGKLANGADFYGKTGSGRHGRNERLDKPSRLRDGWFVGFVERGNDRYIFVSNLTDKMPVPGDKLKHDGPLLPYGSQVLKPMTVSLLNTYFSPQKE